MNVRRPIVYVLLSLLLVLSQQMGIVHALSHWSAQRGGGAAMAMQADGPSAESAAVSKSLALDQSCDQCLAFAQIGSALGVRFYSFPVARDAAHAAVSDAVQALCQRTVCVFRSRAPPVLS